MLLRLALVAAFAVQLSLADREKAFSLFNVVTFKNVDCVSTSTSSTTGPRNGTCYTSEECSEKGGQAAGGCAMGFGTCCLFAYSTCGTEVSQNCSYVRNEGYPTMISAAATCNYKVKKCAEDVCTLRLDFDSFTLLAGTGTIDSLANCQDSFTVTGLTTGDHLPTICGTNTGEHIFVELGTAASDSANLEFKFGNVAGNRGFEVKVTQYACGSPNRPPEGCLQYHTGTEGRIKTFNFAGNTNHLNDQQYNICLRQELGSCCVEYSVCADPNSFTIWSQGAAAAGKAQSDTDCTDDFISIEASSETCGSNALFHRYCGNFLGSDPMNMAAATGANAVICDCTAPFRVGIFTTPSVKADGMTALNDVGMADVPSRGVCLNYVQKACAMTF